MKIIFKAEFEIENLICPQNEIDDILCEICNNSKNKEILAKKEHHFIFQDSNVILLCSHCDEIWITDSDLWNELEYEIK